MTALVAFLRARLDEDEAVARAATSSPWSADPHYDECYTVNPVRMYDYDGVAPDAVFAAVREDAEHIARHDPAQVLREVEAKRRIVDLLGDFTDVRSDYPWTSDQVLRLLALPYSDHPDYREGWKP